PGHRHAGTRDRRDLHPLRRPKNRELTTLTAKVRKSSPHAVHRIWLVIRSSSWVSTVFTQVINRLPGVTRGNSELPACRHALFLLEYSFDFPFSRENDGDYPVKFGCPFPAAPVPPRRRGRAPLAGSWPSHVRALPLRATMRKISRGRHHCRRRVRPGEGR